MAKRRFLRSLAILTTALLLTACGVESATVGPHPLATLGATGPATPGGSPVAGPATPTRPSAPATDARFAPAGAMESGRAGHTASLLGSGQVLVAGGEASRGADSPALSSASLYDPATNRWQAAANMDTGRTNHVWAALKTGEILLAGGESGRGAGATVLNTASLYDPKTNTWRPAAPMSVPRTRFTANALADGTVLVVGGVTTDGRALDSAERYDPATNTWQPAGVIPAGRSSHCTTTLPDGRLLITGGESSPSASGQRNLLSNAGIYDALAKSWTPLADMGSARARHSARVMPGGKVLISGGNMGTDPGQAVSAEVFDIQAGKWQTVKPLTTDRASHTASVLGDGTVLLVGGNGTAGRPLATAELYDAAANNWQTIPMSTARARHSATPLPNGQILIVGGESDGNDNLPTAELFNAAAGRPATPVPGTPGTPAAAASPTRAAPPGQREVILFSAHRGEVHDSQIYVMNADGSGQRQLTATKGHAWGPRIAPDGKTFLFSAVVQGQAHSDHGASGGGLVGSGNHDIYRANVDGANITKLTSEPSWDNGWSWSPDGKLITFTSDRDGNWEIYRMAPDGTQVARLTNSPAQEGWPSWTPDGKTIVFSSNRDGHPQLYSMNADGSNPKRLRTSQTDDTFPFVSPDGKRVVYVSYQPNSNESEIYTMNIDGSGVARLTSTVALNVTPAWSPDGSKIAFSSDRSGNFDIYTMNADGSGLTRLTYDGDNETPSWGFIQPPTGGIAPAANPIVLTAARRETDAVRPRAA